MIFDSNVGIILINWNSYNDVTTCIYSLSQMEYKSFQIIVIDNASSDNSLEKIKKDHPDVFYIESPNNLGFGRANNLGINFALQLGVDYCWILNSDTIVEKSSLYHLTQLMKSDKRLGAIGSALMTYDDKDEVQAMGGGRCYAKMAITTSYKEVVCELEHIIGASFFVRGDVIKALDGFDRDFFFFMEDTDLSLRIRKAGYILGLCAESLVYHKGGSSFEHSKKEKNINSEIYYYESLGIFMKKHSNLFYLLFRIMIMITNRIRRMQFDRILLLSKTMLWGFLSGKSVKFGNENE